MDLGTVNARLVANEYATVEAFVADVHLIFDNAELFNGEHEAISVQGRQLQAIFDGDMARARAQARGFTRTELYASDSPSADDVFDRVKANAVMKKMRDAKCSILFREPVPLGIPMYHDVIKV